MHVSLFPNVNPGNIVAVRCSAVQCRAVQCRAGLGWASLQMQIRISAKTAECGHGVLAVVMTWILGHADISNMEFISKIIKEFIA